MNTGKQEDLKAAYRSAPPTTNLPITNVLVSPPHIRSLVDLKQPPEPRWGTLR